jgi:hypothetical protein
MMKNLIIFILIYVKEVKSMKHSSSGNDGGGGVDRLEKREHCVDI